MKRKLLFLLSFIIIFSGIVLLIFYFGFDNSKPRQPLKVAILDSGIYEKHDFLEDINFKSYNSIENSSNQTEDDSNHGTGIASLIINPLSKEERSNVLIYNVKVVTEDGDGSPDYMIKGLRWAIKEKVDVINISAGFQTNNTEIEDLINQAFEKGIVIIASAGNNLGFDSDYPAKLNNVISISSISSNKTQSLTSSTGKIDFVSIGEKVKVANNKNTYELRTGSSYATAKVTAFLVKSMIEDEKIRGYKNSYKYLSNSANKSISKDKSIFGNGYIE